MLCLLAFTSADIIFHQFLEIHSLLYKKDFRHGFSTPPHPLNGQNPLRVTKVFCQYSLAVHDTQH